MNIFLSKKEENSIKDLITPPSGETELMDHLGSFSTTLCRLMKSQYHAILLFPGRLNSKILLCSNNSKDFENYYNEKLYNQDFLLQELFEHPYKIAHLNDLLKIPEHRESVFINEAQRLRPAGDGLYAAIHIQNELVGFFGQVRAVDSDRFSEAEKILMKLLSPALSCHLEIFRERMNSPSASGSGSHYNFQLIRQRFMLTERETETLNLIFRGYTNKKIASELSIQESTVKRHISNIFEKTGSRNRTQLIFNTALS